MGWEWRFFAALEDGKSDSEDGFDVRKKGSRSSSPERRTDIYLACGRSGAVGAKMRSGSSLEVKLRTAQKKRGAEHYVKRSLNVSSTSDRDSPWSIAEAVDAFVARQSAGIDDEAGADVPAVWCVSPAEEGREVTAPKEEAGTSESGGEGGPSVVLVALDKERVSFFRGGCALEQTDLVVRVAVCGRSQPFPPPSSSSSSDGNRGDSDSPRWTTLPVRYRSVSVESGRAKDIYKVVGKLMKECHPSTRTSLESESADSATASADGTAGPGLSEMLAWVRALSAGDGGDGEPDDDSPVGIFGYPSFVAAIARAECSRLGLAVR
jgi:hypothetical protein